MYDERKIGELIPNIIKHGGDRKSSSYEGNLIQLKDLSIDKHQSSKWRSLPDVPMDKWDEEIQKLKEKKERY